MLEYRASARYGYIGIDLYIDNKCSKTVLTGIKPQKLGYEIANLLNEAYQLGFDNGYDIPDNVKNND